MFKTSLKKIIEGKEVKELNTILQCFLLTYRTTPHCQTHTSVIILQETKHSPELCKTHINRYYC